MITGFKARLFQELNHLLKTARYSERLLIEDFKIHVPISKANYSAWAGASLFGATNTIGTRSFPREYYLRENAIPDWSNLRFNSIYCDERQG
jgi:actin-related protein